jgi:hypothetical protein
MNNDRFLFRAKRIDDGTGHTGEWVEGFICYDGIEYFIQYEWSKTEHPLYLAASIDPVTIAQFTGLIDKNNKKIFENMFIIFDYEGNNDPDDFAYYKVIWDKKSAGFCLQNYIWNQDKLLKDEIVNIFPDDLSGYEIISKPKEVEE